MKSSQITEVFILSQIFSRFWILIAVLFFQKHVLVSGVIFVFIRMPEYEDRLNSF